MLSWKRHNNLSRVLMSSFPSNTHLWVFCPSDITICSAGWWHRLLRPVRCTTGSQARSRSRTSSLWEQWLHGTVWGPEGHYRSVGLILMGRSYWTFFCFCRLFLHFSIFFFLELINNSASNSSFIKINARFVRHQLYSRMWKLSSLLCCQYITVGSQPYKTPLRPCLFCISTPSLPPFSWLSPTSSSSHLSFSICLSSCNISVWPFHPHSLVCPSHLVWNPPPPFLYLTSSWGLSVPPGLVWLSLWSIL